MTHRQRRFVRVGLALYPPAFRRAYGHHVEQLAGDMRAEWKARGRRAGVIFWLTLTADVMRGAAAEWLAAGLRTARSIRSVSMSALATSLRQAARQLWRQPLYSALIVLLVAIGIAGNAAVFRVFDGLFIRPLPFHEPDSLVDLDVTAPEWNLEFVNVSITDFNAWRKDNTTFEHMTAYTSGGGNFAGDVAARRVTVLTATHDIDDVLHLTPLRGRFFTEAEDQVNGPRVGLLSEGFWRQEFGGDPDIIGRRINAGGQPLEVIGILPPEARLVGDADVWMPLQEDNESSFYLRAIGRLRPGATVEQAREELRAIHARHEPDRSVNGITSPTVMLLRDRYLGPQRLGGSVLFGAVAIVLLIACGNIAGLMTARSTARMQELGLRAALGASRGRLTQQLLMESLILAGVGATLGATLGIAGSSTLVSQLADQFPPFVVFDLDLRFVLFVTAVTMGVTVLAGLGPALRASRLSTAVAATTRTTASRGTRRLMSTLVIAEVALATVLLVIAALAVEDMRAIGNIDPGFRTDVLTYRVAPDSRTYPSADDRVAFWDRYRARLQALPGVEHVVISTILPLMGHSGWFFQAEGAATESDSNVVVLRRWVEPGYFEAMRVGVRQGRTFDDFDGRAEDNQVAVVNESFVRTHLDGRPNAVGRRVRTGPQNPWLTVIGVVADTKHYGLDRESRPALYEPVRQNRNRLGSNVGIISAGDPSALADAIRAATREVDPGLAVYDVKLLADRVHDNLSTRRSSSWLIALFSGASLLLATAGLYGVIAYTVGQRTREIGIRMALGAQRGLVQRQVIVQGLKLVAIGGVLGLSAALASARTAASALVTVQNATPAIVASVVGLVLSVALLANWIPARRAGRVELLELLRRE